MKFNYFFFIYQIFYICVINKKITAITVESLNLSNSNSISESDNFECRTDDVIVYDKNSTYIRFFTFSSCVNSCGKAFTDCSCHKTCETQRTCCYDYNRCTQIQTKKDQSNGQCKLTNLDSNDCVQCKEKYYLNNNDCVEKCPSGTEPVEQNKQCRPKTCLQENCDKCRGNICRKCYPGSFLFEGRCLSKCPMKLRADRKSWSCKRRTELSFYYVVPSNYDCTNQCGNSNNSDCSCDYTCLQKGNCCENFMSQCKSEALKENCVLCRECDKEGKCVSCQANAELVSGQCRCSANYRHDSVNDVCLLKSLNNNNKDLVKNVGLPYQIKNANSTVIPLTKVKLGKNPTSIVPIKSSVIEAPSATYSTSQVSQSIAYNNTSLLPNPTLAVQSIQPPLSGNNTTVSSNVDLSPASDIGASQSDYKSPQYPKSNSTVILPTNTINQIKGQYSNGTNSDNNAKKSGRDNIRNINILIGNKNVQVLNLQIKNKK